MACYCQECSEELFGRDFGDFAGQTTIDETRQGIYTWVECESCGSIEVDHQGHRVLRLDEPQPVACTPDTRARAFKDGGVSGCFHCGRQLVRVDGGFIYIEIRDPMGNLVRVHKDCAQHVVGDGYTMVAVP